MQAGNKSNKAVTWRRVEAISAIMKVFWATRYVDNRKLSKRLFFFPIFEICVVTDQVNLFGKTFFCSAKYGFLL